MNNISPAILLTQTNTSNIGIGWYIILLVLVLFYISISNLIEYIKNKRNAKGINTITFTEAYKILQNRYK